MKLQCKSPGRKSKDPKDHKDEDELKILDHPKQGIFVKGLTESPVLSAIEVSKLLDAGLKKRVVGFTNMNASSSRSHAVFTIRVEQISIEQPDPKSQRKAGVVGGGREIIYYLIMREDGRGGGWR
jgi:hypothetical protein